jgi:hypothetical protein
MNEIELKEAVRSALLALPADDAEGRADRLTQLEEELAELTSLEQPGSDRQAILDLVRKCIADARKDAAT